MAAMRSPQEVFGHHAQALGAEDLEEIVADYSDDAVFITRRACNAARTASARRSPSSWARSRRPPGTSRPPSTRTTSCCWSGRQGGGNRIHDGIDTFVFRDGLIRVQTVRYTLRPAG